MADTNRKTLAQILADGGPRPFNPGEFVQNPDGTRSTERTVTVPIGGRWYNIPTLQPK